ncbi:hypothetical protein VCHA53O466_50119 [Vibrio chagasii]|nr:hypothetical protein VCHA53O466_50119 [Vibrio chagasii]
MIDPLTARKNQQYSQWLHPYNCLVHLNLMHISVQVLYLMIDLSDFLEFYLWRYA